jgi:hypothetical protein
MQKLITTSLVLFGLSINLAMAQTTLTPANLEQLGDILIWEGINADTIDVTATGPGLTWNFANLAPSSPPYRQKAQMVTPSSTPYASSFPNANLTAEDTTGLYLYLKINSTEYSIQGMVAPTPGGPTTISYSDPQVLYTLPFGYTSSSSDIYSGTFTGGAITIYRTGSSTSTGDATGTLITPSGTFNNVLRTKRVEVSKDSSNIFGNPVVNNTVITQYEWYGPNNRAALFTYVITETNGGAAVYSGQYLKSAAVGLAQQPSVAIGMSFYPNPVSNSGEFDFSLSERSTVTISLFDIMGKEVKQLLNGTLESGKHSLKVSTTELPSGIYYIRTATAGQVAHYKISVL